MAILAVATLLLLPIFPYKRTHSWIAAPGFVACLRMALCRVRVSYEAQFDRDRPTVFCMNHTNLLDAHVASAAIPHAFCGLMNAWQFHIPFYGWLMRWSKGIPVHSGPAKTILARMTDEAKKRLAEGFSILAFPEAHRTTDGKVHRFRKGVFIMARDAGYPVAPIAVKGLFAINRKGSWKFTPGEISIRVGMQRETAQLNDDELATLAHTMQQSISSFVES
jgi:1-acyl-sn-glycerol-3-phosphate acyltransferase